MTQKTLAVVGAAAIFLGAIAMYGIVRRLMDGVPLDGSEVFTISMALVGCLLSCARDVVRWWGG